MFCLLIRSAALLFTSFASLAATSDANSQAPRITVRVAVMGFARAKAHKVSNAPEAALADELSRDGRVVVIDESMMRAALKGIGYDGSINLSKDQARKLGAAIGCDFFITGKTEAVTRSEHEGESHEAAYVGLMIVDGRTGALAAFDLVLEKASTREAAVHGMLKILAGRTASYVDRMLDARADSLSPPRSGAEPIEDIPDQDSPRAAGFTSPEFLNRVKPEYTSQAELADITATVEAMAILRANGEVGAVDIVRWAGFGLDESAERAIRQLKFNPATRDRKPLSVRALIRYNFRRLDSPNIQVEEPPDQKPPDRPVRDLRELFKPKYRRP